MTNVFLCCKINLTNKDLEVIDVLTKVEIARESGISRVAVTNILNGKQKNPKIQTLEKIAGVLNCSVDELRNKIRKVWY